jgi:hypothetical protein
MPVLIAALLVVLASAAPAAAQVHIDIGIHLPAPPRLVVVPEVHAVQYVPAASANLFFYGNQYWAYVNGGWHVSRGYSGPWVVVAPQVVPRPVLLVPVHYYRVPPGHWKKWQAKHPPQWGHEWGPEWASKRKWKDRDEPGRGDHRGRDDDGRGKGHGKGHAKGYGKGGRD